MRSDAGLGQPGLSAPCTRVAPEGLSSTRLRRSAFTVPCGPTNLVSKSKALLTWCPWYPRAQGLHCTALESDNRADMRRRSSCIPQKHQHIAGVFCVSLDLCVGTSWPHTPSSRSLITAQTLRESAEITGLRHYRLCTGASHASSRCLAAGKRIFFGQKPCQMSESGTMLALIPKVVGSILIRSLLPVPRHHARPPPAQALLPLASPIAQFACSGAISASVPPPSSAAPGVQAAQ